MPVAVQQNGGKRQNKGDNMDQLRPSPAKPILPFKGILKGVYKGSIVIRVVYEPLLPLLSVLVLSAPAQPVPGSESCRWAVPNPKP